jgi:hypothetical protein
MARLPGLSTLVAHYPIELLHNNYHEPRARRDGVRIRWLPEAARTDAEGTFRIEGLIPGLRYELLAGSGDFGPDNPSSHRLDGVTVEAGRTKEVKGFRPR